jgi:hypothetical protein
MNSSKTQRTNTTHMHEASNNPSTPSNSAAVCLPYPIPKMPSSAAGNRADTQAGGQHRNRVVLRTGGQHRNRVVLRTGGQHRNGANRGGVKGIGGAHRPAVLDSARTDSGRTARPTLATASSHRHEEK